MQKEGVKEQQEKLSILSSCPELCLECSYCQWSVGFQVPCSRLIHFRDLNLGGKNEEIPFFLFLSMLMVLVFT